MLTIPVDHPLNHILPVEENVRALEVRLTEMQAKLDKVETMVGNIGQMVYDTARMSADIWRAVRLAQQEINKQHIVVPGRG